PQLVLPPPQLVLPHFGWIPPMVSTTQASSSSGTTQLSSSTTTPVNVEGRLQEYNWDEILSMPLTGTRCS
ncbi:hypothetical protein A2U01_0015133, partial [Trifolium medium]|nr:hypothetical protein [Trifolium medium]